MTKRDTRSEPPTLRELVFDLLSRRLLTIVGLIVIAVGVAYFFDVTISVPRFWQVYGLAYILLLPLGLYFGGYVRDLYIDRGHVFAVDLDPRPPEVDAGLAVLTEQEYRDLEATTGAFDRVAPNLVFLKDLDLADLEAEGTWTGTLSDRELLTALHMIDECRGQLEDDAKVGFTFSVLGWSIVRQATKETVQHVVQTFKSGTLPDEGDALDETVDDALERYDLKDQFHTQAEDLAPDGVDLEATEERAREELPDEELEAMEEPSPEASADD